MSLLAQSDGASSGCLDEATASEFVSGELPAADAARANAHLDGCEKCRGWVAALARGEDAGLAATVASPDRPRDAVGPTGQLAPGQRLDHYDVVRAVGSGGMSLVYAAFDTRLGRTVALKVLRPEMASSANTRARLLREAQAMARLSHPNVLTLYEARESAGLLYIAMEFVEGTTLGRWLQESRRSWPEIVRLFLDAARGLQAAHAAGVVHRDFKPENVLVGKDHRVRVTDFGLARWEGVAPAAMDATLTHSGTFVGTPAYMSPEHLPGGTVDARSDQFSFCVALYEALYGSRPFAGSSVSELAEAIRAGRLEPPRDGRAAPRWLRRAVLKGLRASPADRYPSMQALIDVLEAWIRRARQRRVLLAVLTALLAASAGWAWVNRPPPPSAPRAPVTRVMPPPPPPAPVEAAPVAPAPPRVTPKPTSPKKPIRLDPNNPYAR